MKTQENQQIAESIVNYYKLHNFDRKRTNEHFLDQGVSIRTIQRVLKRYLEHGQIKYDKYHGRPRTALTERNKKKIRRVFVKNPSTSNRKVAQKLKMSESTIRVAKAEMNIVCK